MNFPRVKDMGHFRIRKFLRNMPIGNIFIKSFQSVIFIKSVNLKYHGFYLIELNSECTIGDYLFNEIGPFFSFGFNNLVVVGSKTDQVLQIQLVLLIWKCLM